MRLDESISPRRWQREALARWSPTRSGIAKVVTGGGKTVFAYLCLENFFDHHPDGRAVIVVPTVALLDQWFVDIADATDISEAEIACYSGESHPKHPEKINIIVLNSARKLGAELAEGCPTMLVVDECHRAGSPENSLALVGDHQATLGLSATPERNLDDGFEEHLTPILGSIVYSYDYADARADGVIVEFALVNVEIAVSPDEALQLPGVRNRTASLENRSPRGGGSRRKPDATAVVRATEAATRVPWAVKLALMHRDERVIIFHERVESLKRIVKLLQKYGQNSVAYHSKLSPAHRRDNLRLFRNGVVNVLATCRALDEGTNVPEANVAIVAHSTSSTRQRIQRLGRVLRPAKGKAHASVFTLYAGEEEAKRLSNEAAGLQGVAKTLWKKGAVR